MDELGINETEQRVYLLDQGFITGKKVEAEEISKDLGISPLEIEEIISRLKKLMME